MNRQHLIEQGLELKEITDLQELIRRYTVWKEDVLSYGDKNGSEQRLRLMLHVVNIPFGTKEEKWFQYHSCIQKTVRYLQEHGTDSLVENDRLETIIKNFGSCLQYLFRTEPEKRATLKKEVLEQIEINNEYDVQHMMYALIKTLYPSARKEVNQDMGCGTVRYDIVIEEIDTVIEIKCTRKDHNDNRLCRELGEDGYFYQCSRLIIYVYDKRRKIQDVGNFIKALERTRETAGKDIKVYVDQSRSLV